MCMFDIRSLSEPEECDWVRLARSGVFRHSLRSVVTRQQCGQCQWPGRDQDGGVQLSPGQYSAVLWPVSWLPQCFYLCLSVISERERSTVAHTLSVTGVTEQCISYLHYNINQTVSVFAELKCERLMFTKECWSVCHSCQVSQLCVPWIPFLRLWRSLFCDKVSLPYYFLSELFI